MKDLGDWEDVDGGAKGNGDWVIGKYGKETRRRTLFNLFAGVRPCRSSITSSPRAFVFVATRKLGTLSLSAAILSFRFVRYRFSIMLWAVFLTGGWRLFPFVADGGDWKSSSSSSEASLVALFRFSPAPLHCSGSGDSVEDGEEGYARFREGIAWAISLDCWRGVKGGAKG